MSVAIAMSLALVAGGVLALVLMKVGVAYLAWQTRRSHAGR